MTSRNTVVNAAERFTRSVDATLKGSGGGGTFDGMEQRVAKLENQFEKLNEKVDTLRIDVAVLKERVGNLPSKGFIVTATVTSLALVGALSVFGERIISLLGN
jgi:hypothetical protein